MKVKTAIIGGILDVVILAAAVVTTQLALEGDARSGAVGIMGAALNILMYASPLAVMVSFIIFSSDFIYKQLNFRIIYHK
jgi:solute carrier family 50 protein (sugar transporter)